MTLLLGPAEALFDVFDPGDGLLAPGVPLAEAVRGETDLRALGYLPRHGTFPAAEGAASPPPVVVEPPSRDQLMRRTEMDLRLDAGDRRRVQQRLAILGHDPRGIDGDFDGAPRRAIRRFQQARGLSVTGHVDQATMARLLLGG